MAQGEAEGVKSPPTQSPCVSICKLDPKGQFCIGCGRTLAQIAAAGNAAATRDDVGTRR
jgi:predicted Fe-S protein YdhL (DUF1289 family)